MISYHFDKKKIRNLEHLKILASTTDLDLKHLSSVIESSKLKKIIVN